MKKLLSEEKTDLRHVCISSKIIIFVLLFSTISFSQIPINGFCKLDKISASSGFNKIFSFNYNKDSYSDLLLFNPLNSEAEILTGEQSLKFSIPKSVKFPFEPSQFKPVYDSLLQISYYAFTSRRSRLFGTLLFNENGNPTVIESIKLNSYPEMIDVFTETDGKSVFLVCGKSFDGISTFTTSNESLKEEKVISGTSFPFAQFVHLNGDGIIDIIAYNLFEKSLFFLINNGRNEFNVSRKIQLGDEVNYLHIFDINLDSFKDIIYSDKAGIKILLGDPIYLFEKQITVATNFSVDNISVADFNHDGYFDLLYSSNESGIISVVFAKNYSSFYNELIYLQTSLVSDIIPFFSRFIYGAVYVNESGEIGILSEVNSFKEDLTLSLAILPQEIIVFDYNNNGINDLAFIDRKDKQLKFILRNNVGIPAYYYSIKLFSDNTELLCFDNEINSEKIFYVYSQNQKLIEVLYVNFSKFSFSRENLYVEGALIDFMVTPSTERKPNLHVLARKKNNLHYGVYSFSSIKYVPISYPEVTGSWFDAMILNPYKNQIAYWLENQNQYQLIFKEFVLQNSKSEIVYNLDTENKVVTFSAKAILSEDLILFSSIIEDQSRIRLVLFDQNVAVFSRRVADNQQLKNSLIGITDRNHLSFGNDNLLYFYNNTLKNFNRIFVNRYYGRFNIIKIFDDINIKRFLVTKLDTRNKHLVYIDSIDNLIKVKKIS